MTGLLIPEFQTRLRTLPVERQVIARILARHLNAQLLVNAVLMVLLALLLKPWQGDSHLAVAALPVYLALLTLAIRTGQRIGPTFSDQDVLGLTEQGPKYLFGGAGAVAASALLSTLEGSPDWLLLLISALLNLLCVAVHLAALVKLMEDAPRRPRKARRPLNFPVFGPATTRALVPIPVTHRR